jgi:hypothetical protein
MRRTPLTEADRQHRRDVAKAWRAANPERVKAYNAKRTKEQQARADRVKYAKHKDKIKARVLAHYHANHDAAIARKQRYSENNREEIRERARQWAKDNADKVKEWAWESGIKRRHGMTRSDYEKIYNEQSGLCAICGQPPREGKKLCIDHNHDTGAIRGLLCRNCNAAIGQLNDDIGMLKKAIQYLIRYTKPKGKGK